ncbi:hypothetical protein GCM10010964_00380 [Caldovatus sediminis]|uniref:Uncharacterized protein n=1 Tax=Caldovatus sediminis TaxID=2041189 RepID=A0A8J3EAG0_9PROT|nr:hypothetical protein GCM10010964_00380 [Caldovatus sediminis]
MARRVGSARAAKVRLRRSAGTKLYTKWLKNLMVKYRPEARPSTPFRKDDAAGPRLAGRAQPAQRAKPDPTHGGSACRA